MARLGGGLWRQVLASALLVAVLGGGCSSTFQARKAVPSGFLGDYSQLRPGTGDEALLVYFNPQADFKKYTGLMIDPIRMYAASPDSDLAKVPREDQQRLVNYFDATLREHLKKDCQIVEKPGPDVIRLRVAITEAEHSNVVLDTVSTLLPIAIATSALQTVALGSSMAVGKVGVEFEVLDSVTGERLAAAVDARVGRKITGNFDKFNSWRAAEDSFDYWAERLQRRVREIRGKTTAM